MPNRQMIGSPCQGSIEMAEIACVGASGRQLVADIRAANLGTANGGQNAVGGMRHVAIVTLAPGGSDSMVRMRRDGRRLAKSLVTLRAGAVIRAVAG